MFEFARTDDLWFLWLVPLLFIMFLVIRYIRKTNLRKLGDSELVEFLMPMVSVNRPVLKFVLFMMALVFVILAVAGPRFGMRLEEVKREGVEIIFALDVSTSMLAEDISPSRLERSKMAISRLIGNMMNDKVGLIVFAGDAFVQVPLTSDYSAARMILDNISTDLVPVQGTAIGRAIEMATRSFSRETSSSKVLIIISDGEDHEDNPVRAAAVARESGVKIYTIGMGRPDGAPVPVADGGQVRFLTDQTGNTVISKLDENTLRGIASAGDGLFVRAGSGSDVFEIIMDEIEKLDKEEFEEMVYTEYEERFQYMAALALFMLILDFFISERKSSWLKGITLFGNNEFSMNQGINKRMNKPG
jgi:Ca-activated chloride channel homolog